MDDKPKTDSLEDKLYAVLGELGQLLASERLAEALGDLIAGASRTKASLDRNIDGLLGLANIPTRSEFRRLETKVDALQASVLSLSRKVERAAAGSKKKAAKAVPKESPSKPSGEKHRPASRRSKRS